MAQEFGELNSRHHFTYGTKRCGSHIEGSEARVANGLVAESQRLQRHGSIEPPCNSALVPLFS